MDKIKLQLNISNTNTAALGLLNNMPANTGLQGDIPIITRYPTSHGVSYLTSKSGGNVGTEEFDAFVTYSPSTVQTAINALIYAKGNTYIGLGASHARNDFPWLHTISSNRSTIVADVAKQKGGIYIQNIDLAPQTNIQAISSPEIYIQNIHADLNEVATGAGGLGTYIGDREGGIAHISIAGVTDYLSKDTVGKLFTQIFEIEPEYFSLRSVYPRGDDGNKGNTKKERFTQVHQMLHQQTRDAIVHEAGSMKHEAGSMKHEAGSMKHEEMLKAIFSTQRSQEELATLKLTPDYPGTHYLPMPMIQYFLQKYDIVGLGATKMIHETTTENPDLTGYMIHFKLKS